MLRMVKAFGLACAISAGPVAANLVENGSFEFPDVSATSTDGLPYYFYTLTSGRPSNWQSTGENVTIFDSRAGGWEAYSGNQFVKLELFTSLEIASPVPTVSGQAYKVTFAYAPEPLFSSGTEDAIGVKINGIQQLSVDLASTQGNSLEWSLQSFVFQATGPISELRFVGLGPSLHRGGFIDAVSVTAVPEPGIYGLMLAGLGLVGFAARGRRRS